MTALVGTRSDHPPRRRGWAGPAALGLGVAAATVVVAVRDPNAAGAYPECALRSSTGLDCPVCGGLRAVHALAHGDLVTALDHNLLVVVALAVAVVAWGWWLLRSLGTPLPEPPRWASRTWVRVGLGAAGVLLAFTVARNVGGPTALEYLASPA